jgi:GNAT superfamily N-acetyltransferase
MVVREKNLNTPLTVYELPPRHFARVAPLYAGAWFDQVCYDAVFEGRQPARIFADHPSEPTSALMFRTYEYFPAGAVHLAMRQFIKDAPEEIGEFQNFYGYAPVNDAWKQALLADLPLEIIERQNFQWRPGTPAPEWRVRLPPDATIVPMDRAMAEMVDQKDFLPFISMFWSGYDRYVKHGFGFCLMVGDQLASSIFALATSSKHALISVETQEQFRRRSFATLVSARFIEHCLENGLLPVWDCDRANVPSAATAARLGFVEEKPFVELAFPKRGKPTMTQGVWEKEAVTPSGIVAWQRKV